MPIEVRYARPEQLPELAVTMLTPFGMPFVPERLARSRDVAELEKRIGAYEENGRPVGAMGSFSFTLSAPGPRGASAVPVPTAGLTMVGVLPTHRRRGVLTSMMRLYLTDLRREGRALSALWATEGVIYGRYGYGLATLAASVEIDRDRSAFLAGASSRADVRFVSEDEALASFPAIWDEARRQRPGMLSRSPSWWRHRRIADAEWERAGRAPLQRVRLTEDGRLAGYALYRQVGRVEHGIFAGSVDVKEALAISPSATRALWRYLLDFDLVSRISAEGLCVDHPLLLLASEPQRLRMRVGDGLYVRVLDVPAALSARGYGAGPKLVLAIQDAFFPDNDGRYGLEDGKVARTDAPADIALDVSALGSAYLGGFSFTQLADAGRVTELRAGALLDADALFRSAHAPWCPEVF
jgi:predicted acetyltransferase